MTQCPYTNFCGGCSNREYVEETYQKEKIKKFMNIISGIQQEKITYGSPIFIGDGERRRASLAFQYQRGKVILGFNQKKSKEIVDIQKCLLITENLNNCISWIRNLLEELCTIPFTIKSKKKKRNKEILTQGDVLICEAENGIDIVLEFDKELDLAHRMIISEYAQKKNDILRISHRYSNQANTTETIIEKQAPYIKISEVNIEIPAGGFMQASKKSEKALREMVLKYVGTSNGKIADLFCGIGTFSYPLAKDKNNQITAIDSSENALQAFIKNVKKNMLHNIEIKNKNLFKYPLSPEEIKSFDIIIFDPPRAGAHAQIKNIVQLQTEERPKKIIGISCNPQTFVTDANLLVQNGYEMKEITMVDQFIYSPHMELVALFEEQSI